jgi:hypothetical protein
MKKYIIILLCATSCAYPSTDEISDDDILKLSVISTNKSLPADGSSIIELNAIIPSNADDSKRTVTFSTSDGVFVSTSTKTDQQKADITGKAISQLKSTLTPAIIFISAELAGYKRTEKIEFLRAYPEKIIVETGTQDYKVKESNYPIITTKLIRSIGKPSLNTEVILKAFDASGTNEIGIFKNLTFSNSSGEVSANFVLSQLTYRGKCIIKATVNNVVSTTVISGESSLNIVD